MDSLDSFVDEMLSLDESKKFMLEDLLRLLAVQPLPTLEQSQHEYDYKTNLHGVIFDYLQDEVTLRYLVVPELHPAHTMTFSSFEVVLEGILYCQRKYKW